MKTIIPECYSSGYNIHLSTHSLKIYFFPHFILEEWKKFSFHALYIKYYGKRCFPVWRKKHNSKRFCPAVTEIFLFIRTKSEGKLYPYIFTFQWMGVKRAQLEIGMCEIAAAYLTLADVTVWPLFLQLHTAKIINHPNNKPHSGPDLPYGHQIMKRSKIC